MSLCAGTKSGLHCNSGKKPQHPGTAPDPTPTVCLRSTPAAIISWDEPENITGYEEQDDQLMNEAETEPEIDSIVEAVKRKNTDMAEVFVRYYLQGYEV